LAIIIEKLSFPIGSECMINMAAVDRALKGAFLIAFSATIPTQIEEPGFPRAYFPSLVHHFLPF
jgi:hypothetical protein